MQGVLKDVGPLLSQLVVRGFQWQSDMLVETKIEAVRRGRVERLGGDEGVTEACTANVSWKGLDVLGKGLHWQHM
jgi:hypothetical protein